MFVFSCSHANLTLIPDTFFTRQKEVFGAESSEPVKFCSLSCPTISLAVDQRSVFVTAHSVLATILVSRHTGSTRRVQSGSYQKSIELQ